MKPMPIDRQRRQSLISVLTGGCLMLPLVSRLAVANTPPALMLAKAYQPGVDLRGYWVSEKLDGVRGRWDGRQLLTRGGQLIAAPSGFTANWPAVPLDGELWLGRGRFEDTVSAVRQQAPNELAWRQLRFMLFDLPEHPGTFSERLSTLQALVQTVNQPWLQALTQTRGSTHADLMQQLDAVVQQGGEGLMLHRAEAHYRAQRSDDLLKVKKHQDADARVIGYEAGKGRLIGQVGALIVETSDGRRFRLGSGLSDAQRRHPPPIGSWITYRFRGTHDSGLPRFATWVRIRTDADLQDLR